MLIQIYRFTQARRILLKGLKGLSQECKWFQVSKDILSWQICLKRVRLAFIINFRGLTSATYFSSFASNLASTMSTN
jgi:hypothetical protein